MKLSSNRYWHDVMCASSTCNIFDVMSFGQRQTINNLLTLAAYWLPYCHLNPWHLKFVTLEKTRGKDQPLSSIRIRVSSVTGPLILTKRGNRTHFTRRYDRTKFLFATCSNPYICTSVGHSLQKFVLSHTGPIMIAQWAKVPLRDWPLLNIDGS
jgi:hypothetical protein